eukprot:scaffold1415_cov152-Skeletonema_menzelii.AAC.9
MRVTAERNSRCSEDVLLLFDRQFRVERESGGGFLGNEMFGWLTLRHAFGSTDLIEANPLVMTQIHTLHCEEDAR